MLTATTGSIPSAIDNEEKSTVTEGAASWTAGICSTPAFGMQQLLAMPHPDLLDLWKALPPPPLDELEGEYECLLPINGMQALVEDLIISAYQEDSENGYWIGKAYRALSDTGGEGYNVFRSSKESGGYRYTRKTRFGLHIGSSLIDGRPALIMTYGDFRNQIGDKGLVDEIRKFAKGLYLGAGTRPTREGGRAPVPQLDNRSGGCFLLTGPFGPWVGVDDPDLEVK